MINNNKIILKIVGGWKMITTAIHKNIESNILANTFHWPISIIAVYYVKLKPFTCTMVTNKTVIR